MENTESRRVRRLTWVEYGEYLSRFCELVKSYQEDSIHFEAVSGIPRGGVPIAVSVSHYFDIDYRDPVYHVFHTPTLLVDDICDTGSMMKGTQNWGDASLVVRGTLFVRERTQDLVQIFVEVTDDWVIFPYEAQ